LPEQNYFCATPQVFFSFIFHALEGLLSDDAVRYATCSKQRSRFLEDEVKKIFTQAFPQAIFEQNFKWREGNVEYETDLLLKIDSYLLIIQWYEPRGKPRSVFRPKGRGMYPKRFNGIKPFVV
jgi:hypothetical protein